MALSDAGSDIMGGVKAGNAGFGRHSAGAHDMAFASTEPSEPESEKGTEDGLAPIERISA